MNRTQYVNILNEINTQINRYCSNVDNLWANVMEDYIQNSHGLILTRDISKLREGFREMMGRTHTIRALLESKRRVLFCISKLEPESDQESIDSE